MSKSQLNAEPQPPKKKAEQLTETYQSQFEALFSDRLPLASDPATHGAEVAALRARVAELETQLVTKAAAQSAPLDAKPAAHLDDERYRDLFDNTANLIQNVAMDGSFIYVNRAWLETLGYSEDEVAGLNLFNVIHPTSQPHCMNLFQQIQSGSQSVFVEADFVSKSGQVVVIEGTTSTLFKDGQPASTRGIFVNVTDRRRAEEELRKSREQFELATEGTNDGLWDWDMRTGVVYFSPRWKAMVGYEDNEIAGNFAEFEKLLHPEDRESVLAKVGDYLAGKLPAYDLEFRFHHKDGSYRWIRARGKALRDADGKPFRMAGSHTDITASKEVEAELTKFKMGIEQSGDAIFITDTTGQIVYTNPGFEKVYGYSATDAIGKTPRIIKSGIVPQELYKQFWQTLLSKNVVAGEIINKAKDGRLLNIEGSNNPIIDSNGQIVGFLAIHHDITERKRAEAAIRTSEEQLTEASRLAKLANWEFDFAHNEFVFNDAFYALFHTTVESEGGYRMTPEHYSQRFVHPEDIPIVGASIEHVLAGRELHQNIVVEHRVLYADGGVGFMVARVNVDKDEQGNLLRYYGANQDITERKQAEALLAQRAIELQAVADISTAASTLSHEQEMLENVVNLAKDRFHLYHAHIYLLDERSESLVLKAGAGTIGKQMVSAGRFIPLNQPNSLVARAARTATGTVANDVTQEPDFLPNPLLPDTRSELATPIIVGTKVLGVFDVQSDVINRFTEQDIAIETTLALQIGAALQNVRSLEQAQAAIAELDILTRRLTREGWSEYQTRELVQENFVYDLPQAHDNGHTGPPPEPSTVATALTVRGEAIGQLELANPAELEEAQAISQAIGERLSAHIENLRLADQTQMALSQAQKRAVEIQTVAEVTTATSTILERDQLLERAVHLTQRRFNLYHCHVYLFDSETDRLNIIACGWREGDQHEDLHRVSTIPVSQERSLAAQAARERRPVAVNDVAYATNWLPDDLLPETRSEVAIPMTVGDTLIGVFAAQSERINRFTSEDVQAFITLANAIAIAVQNAQLYSEQTLAANRLREMDRLKSTFLANMSHELRTPLNSVIGYTDVILEGLDGPLTEPMEVDLRTVQRNGQHLLSLINDVLDMAKIESGKLSLAVRPFDLREVLTDIIDITSPLARDRNVELRLETLSPSLSMEGDDMRLRQVVLNVVNNAIKFTDSGGQVAIQAERINGHIRVKIQDNGIGIPPDKLDVVFQEFTQVDASTTRKVGGTGLGLPISRHLISLHGGRLWAESTGVRGEGSTFTIEVPVESQIGEDNQAVTEQPVGVW